MRGRASRAAALPVRRRSDDSHSEAAHFVASRGNCLLFSVLAAFPGALIMCHISLTTFLVLKLPVICVCLLLFVCLAVIALSL